MADQIGGAKPPKPKPPAAGDPPADNVRELKPPKSDKPPLQAPGAGHNSEAEEAQYLQFSDRHRKYDQAIDALMVQVKAIKDDRKVLRSAMKTSGINLAVFDETEKDVKLNPLDRKDKEEARARYREWRGLPVGSQVKLFVNTPVHQRTEIEWESDGYRAGVAGEDGDPQKSKVPPEFHQAWLKGWHNGQERNAWALSAAGKVVDRKVKEAAEGPSEDVEEPAEGTEDDETAESLH